MCAAQVCAVASGQVARIESGGPFQPVAAHDERVGRAPVSQLAQHRRLMLGVLAADRAQPQAQDVALCGQIDACGDVDGPVRDLRVADFDGYRVDQKHRIDGLRGPVLPHGHVGGDLAGGLRGRLTARRGVVDLG